MGERIASLELTRRCTARTPDARERGLATAPEWARFKKVSDQELSEVFRSAALALAFR
jgi:hypothetical protein